MYDLILYDTSNFADFPIGGQLTSIRHFLKYLADYQPEAVQRVLLVGITTQPEQVGKLQLLDVEGGTFAFLPVIYRERELANVQGSLRVAYLKALFRHHKSIPAGRNTVHYIHTPEAYIPVKLLHPRAKTAVFSHGSFFNMAGNFRFFNDNKLIDWLFDRFVVWLLKTANRIFVLDERSAAQYSRYTKKVVRAENSVVIPENVTEKGTVSHPVRLLFAGRLSKVKRIESIIDAVALAEGSMCLTILGDGEERSALEQKIRESQAGNNITMAGSVPPGEMRRYFPEHDILVMNSSVEGKPMTVLEAMCYGLPLVATPVGGIPEMVGEGKSAEFTDGTAEDILRKVSRITENYAAYSRQARSGVRRYDYRTVNAAIWKQLTEMGL